VGGEVNFPYQVKVEGVYVQGGGMCLYIYICIYIYIRL